MCVQSKRERNTFPSGVIADHSFQFSCFFCSNSNCQMGDIGSNANNEMIMEWLWKRSEEITGEGLCGLPNHFKFLKESNNRFP